MPMIHIFLFTTLKKTPHCYRDMLPLRKEKLPRYSKASKQDFEELYVLPSAVPSVT